MGTHPRRARREVGGLTATLPRRTTPMTRPFRTVQGFTIDAAPSTDLDDAIWVTPIAGGGWRLLATIAAAGAAITADSVDEGPDRAALLQTLDSAEMDSALDLDALTTRVDSVLGRASYSPTPEPHWGLALDLYTHLTSPIRRYADLISQRQLVAFLRDEPLPHTQGDLQRVSDHLNRTLSDRQDLASARHADAANDAGRRALTSPLRILASLDATRFERVVKVAARSGQDCPSNLEQAVLARIGAGKLPVLCGAVILFETPTSGEAWARVRTTLVHQLATSAPGDATSILATATSLRYCPQVEREMREEGAAGPFTAVSRIYQGPGVRASVPMTANKKKLAAALADVALLASYRDIPLPDVVYGVVPPAQRRLVLRAGQNPVEALNELHCQEHRRPASFELETSPPREFICRCRVVLGGVEVVASGTGTSKSAARGAAARSVLDQLVAKGAIEQAP